MVKGQKITCKKTGKIGIFIRKNPRKLSIELWDVKFNGDNHEIAISPTLLLEGQFGYGHKQR